MDLVVVDYWVQKFWEQKLALEPVFWLKKPFFYNMANQKKVCSKDNVCVEEACM